MAKTTDSKAAKTATPEQQARGMRAQAAALEATLAAGGVEGKAAKAIQQRVEQLRADADTIAPLKGKTKGEPRPTCIASKQDGTPCTAKAMAGREVCTDHRAPVEHLTEAEVAYAEQLMKGSTADFVAFVGWGKIRQAAKMDVPLEQAKDGE